MSTDKKIVATATILLALVAVVHAYLCRQDTALVPTLADPNITSPSQVTSETVLAYSIAKMMVKRDNQPAPPTPEVPTKPKVGDICPHCKGTGREPGDGTVNISCGQCRGDGRVDEGDPIITDTSEEIEKILDELEDTFDEKKITVMIEGILYTYEPRNGYFYTPDRTRVLSIDPILPGEIGKIKSIQTCSKETGICRQYLLMTE